MKTNKDVPFNKAELERRIKIDVTIGRLIDLIEDKGTGWLSRKQVAEYKVKLELIQDLINRDYEVSA